jgi:hypothetical protein
VVVEPLPGYAADLNPVEGLWASVSPELAKLFRCDENSADQLSMDSPTWSARGSLRTNCTVGSRVGPQYPDGYGCSMIR